MEQIHSISVGGAHKVEKCAHRKLKVGGHLVNTISNVNKNKITTSFQKTMWKVNTFFTECHLTMFEFQLHCVNFQRAVFWCIFMGSRGKCSGCTCVCLWVPLLSSAKFKRYTNYQTVLTVRAGPIKLWSVTYSNKIFWLICCYPLTSSSVVLFIYTVSQKSTPHFLS